MTLPLLILTPLAVSVLIVLFGRRLPRGGDWLAIAGLVVSWALALSLFVPVFLAGAAPPVDHHRVDWLVLDGVRWTLGVIADPLQIAMFFVVTTVSLLVHIFSAGYMHGHERYPRFFALISFFTFAMLGLVGADNLVYLFICWELMGFCSYMLIGFYFEKESAFQAAIKAFLTTRVGDVALMVGLAILYAETGDLTYAGLKAAAAAGAIGREALLAASFFILCGAIGKSAQFPLHTWLPDAMEGPSPVSALIHAATMVAAGIYLVGRCIFLGLFPPEMMALTALVGSFTAIFSATMALAEYDFKKVLAYSTISQLGFMLTALGVGGWTAGFFHLTTHAFFKALLFLGSGAVLHAVETRDMREMGGLKSKMPITFWTMFIGSLALAGFPLLAGFFSKDMILAAALLWGQASGGWHYLPFAFLIVAALMTAFYTFRMVILVFNGHPRDHHRHEHAHEAPASMWAPLVVLAVLAVSAGWGWLRTPFEALVTLGGSAHGAHGAGEGAAEAAHAAHLVATVASVGVVILGIGAAYLTYFFQKIDAAVFTRGPVLSVIHRVLVRHYWVDELYAFLVAGVVRLSRLLGIFDRVVIDALVVSTAPFLLAASRTAGVADSQGVDGLVNGTADATRLAGTWLRRLQTGRIQDYVMGAMAAVLLLVVWLSR